MGFFTAVRLCILQKYVAFQGRASRSEFWWFMLAFVLGALVTQLIWFPLYVIFSLGLFLPLLSVGYRRLQDTGRPGWYIYIPFALSILANLFGYRLEGLTQDGALPGVGSIILALIFWAAQLITLVIFLWWLTRPSQPETNPFGPVPVPQP